MNTYTYLGFMKYIFTPSKAAVFSGAVMSFWLINYLIGSFRLGISV